MMGATPTPIHTVQIAGTDDVRRIRLGVRKRAVSTPNPLPRIRCLRTRNSTIALVECAIGQITVDLADISGDLGRINAALPLVTAAFPQVSEAPGQIVSPLPRVASPLG
ncbi:MAG: hypothetical protein DWB60_11695 [Armatimonadetes bacterium]|nr:hypothetical protein [Armatimonadota bacterium]